MNTSPAFEWLSKELPRYTALSPLQARGTIRLMLQEVGIDPRALRKDQLLVLLHRRLPLELRKRRIEAAADLVNELTARLRSTPLSESEQPDTADSVFGRLGRT